MKLVKEWYDNEFYVEISAEFVANGDSYLDDNWDRVYYDIVKFEGKIFNGEVDPIETFVDTANAHERVIKYRWFKNDDVRRISMKEDYIDKLCEMTNDCEKKIANIRRSKKMTDGLPDSLIGI